MNMKYLFFSLSLFALVFSSCKEETVGLQPQDNVPPGTVSDVAYTSIPGGAVFSYRLPDDEDLLYVKAVYYRKEGVPSEARATIYADSLKIEGFGDTLPKEVKLIAVDRSSNESAPVTQMVTPLEPDIFHIGESLDLVSDFGGVHAYWNNPHQKEISVVVMKKDHNDEYVPIETFYSSMANGEGTRRGMDTIPAEFAVFAQDRWENKCETKFFTLTPIYETLFDRLLFKAVHLPNDGPDYPGGWVMEEMWNGVTGNNGYSSLGGQGVWPQSFTIDLGVTGQVSRLRIYQRLEPYIFTEGNIRNFEVWGCQDPVDMSGNWDSWTRLMDCESIKPSGLPLGQNTSEDIARAKDGEDFVNSPINPMVKYIRIKVLRTWAGGDNLQISEIAVYGDNRKQ
jgi:hypothetical protein